MTIDPMTNRSHRPNRLVLFLLGSEICVLLLALFAATSVADDLLPEENDLLPEETVVVLPGEVRLTGSDATQTLLVERVSSGIYSGPCPDPAVWTSSDEQVVRIVDDEAIPTGNGKATISVQVGKQSASAHVTVEKFHRPFGWEFSRHVIPLLSKAGCNAGACHGALAGKGGFKLSLNGYDPTGDHSSITQQARGRRIELADPGRSLLLAKPTGALPHKGGLKLDPKSQDYQILSQWIMAGADPPIVDGPALDRIEVEPAHALLQVGDSQRLIVRAFYSDGRVEDVTRWAKFTSTEATVAKVDSKGRLTVLGSGEGAIVVWFSSRIVLSRVTSPFEHELPPEVFAKALTRNLIDDHVNDKLRQLNLAPSPRCSDEIFLRRASIDTIGTLPAPEETIAFLDDSAADKRDRLIDSLLERKEFVDYWTYRWSDILLVNGKRLRPQAVKTYYQWIRNHIEQETPWDQIVREIVTALGSNFENGATNFYAIHTSPEEMAENVSQAFLGLSINCAKCHNHPLEKWTNDQYYAMANLFARVRAKGWEGSRSGEGERTVFIAKTGDLVQPRTGFPQPPTPLDGQPLEFDDPRDRRNHLAEWLTSPDNPYFTRSIVNRVWHAYFGVGLIESVDDLRISNPASNEELLDSLCQFLVEHQYDLKTLMRLILQSETYQRTSQPIEGNREDGRFYSRYYPRRLMAEVLLDAISQVSGVPSTFDKISYDGADTEETKEYSVGTRSTQLYDSAVLSKFLAMFGRNDRDIVCECQRSNAPSMVQVLHINNGETINEKLRNEKSCVTQYLQSEATESEIITDAYLRTLSRRPTEGEQTKLRQVFATALDVEPATGQSADGESPDAQSSDAQSTDAIRREVIEDLYWSLMSSREFLFQH